ncbi:MAG: putative porin [Verrucomicrobiota bacterium]|jgi:hypothetical protein
MKKTRTTKTTRAALFAGAAAFMSIAPVTYAQSSDALINKLEQKGVLSAEEAKELREESRQDFNNNFTNSFDRAFGKITGMPDWVTGYKLSGDFRGRFDDFTGDNPDFPDRIRLRYRLRVGLAVNMRDDLQVGFRVSSGDPAPGTGYGGNPNSNNSTFQDNFTKKFLYIDAAYGRWTPINDGTWMVATTIGKMDNPFPLSPMVFDPDLTPEGAALQAGYKFNDSQSLALIGAAFVLDEQKLSSQDPFMYGAQLLWNAKWAPKLESSLGVAVFDIVNGGMLTIDSVPTVNLGNTRVLTVPLTGGLNATTYGLAYNYNPVIGDASVTYTLDSFPLYKGKFPIKLAAEFMENPGAPNNNEGYWGGVMFGKSGKKGTWDISYRYQYLEADAWYDQMVDDDNVAFYSNPVNGGPGLSTSGSGAPIPLGVYGGTNIKGHLVKFDYSITDALTFSITCYVNDLINPALNVAPGSPFGTGQPQNNMIHAMADIMWKF